MTETNLHHCITCGYSTNKKYNWNVHINSKRHALLIGAVTGYNCDICDSYYDNYDEYNNHHKECVIQKRIETEVTNRILNNKNNNENNFYKQKISILEKRLELSEKQCIELTKQVYSLENENQQLEDKYQQCENKMKELETQNAEINKQVSDLIIEKNTLEKVVKLQMSNANYVEKKTFCLKQYLNETCANAFNIIDFVQLIEITDELLIRYLREGSKILLNQTIQTLGKYNEIQFPFQCSDEKRQIIYVKNDNEWECENEYTDNKNPLYLYFVKLSVKMYSKINKMTEDECNNFINKYEYGSTELSLKRVAMLEHSKKTIDYDSAKSLLKEFKKMLSTACIIHK